MSATGGFFGFFPLYCILYGFICRLSDSTVSEDAGIEPWTVATSALAVRSSHQSARSHPQNRRIAYQQNDEGRFYTCISTYVLMYLNMNCINVSMAEEEAEAGLHRKTHHPSRIITINVPLFKKLRDIIFFGGRITL